VTDLPPKRNHPEIEVTRRKLTFQEQRRTAGSKRFVAEANFVDENFETVQAVGMTRVIAEAAATARLRDAWKKHGTTRTRRL
jgi:hypothetical protein